MLLLSTSIHWVLKWQDFVEISICLVAYSVFLCHALSKMRLLFEFVGMFASLFKFSVHIVSPPHRLREWKAHELSHFFILYTQFYWSCIFSLYALPSVIKFSSFALFYRYLGVFVCAWKWHGTNLCTYLIEYITYGWCKPAITPGKIAFK